MMSYLYLAKWWFLCGYQAKLEPLDMYNIIKYFVHSGVWTTSLIEGMIDCEIMIHCQCLFDLGTAIVFGLLIGEAYLV